MWRRLKDKKAAENKNIAHLDEFNLTKETFKKKIIQLLKQRRTEHKNDFDKYKIGKIILNDITAVRSKL